MNTLVLNDLSSCEAIPEIYYVTQIRKNKVTHNLLEKIVLEVDRGVDFHVLAQELLDFPRLEVVELSQNYTVGKDSIEEFVRFVEILRLSKIKLVDMQSQFLKCDPNELFIKLASDCTYEFSVGFGDSESPSLTTHINPSNNKFMIFTYT